MNSLFQLGRDGGAARNRFALAKASRWTFCGDAVASGLFASLFGAPLENVANALVSCGGSTTWIIEALIVAILAMPTAWVFYSERA